MGTAASPGRAIRFGTFELDLAAGELRKNGLKIRLQEQPFRLLVLLVEQPGEVVSREEVREKLWPSDTYVDFDRSLNTAASKLRDALGDSATSPRFIETLPRRGYRFLASVEGVGHETGGPESSTGTGALQAASPRVDGKAAEQSDLRRKLRVQQALLAVTAVALLAVSFVHFRQSLPEAPLRRFTITPLPLNISFYNTDVALSPDGRHIAFKSKVSGLSIQGLDRQQPRLLESIEEAVNPFWSPGSDFIGFVAQGELKKVSIHGGPAIRICEMPHSTSWGSSWSPDGEWIVFTTGYPPVLYEVSASGGTPKLLVSPEESEGSSGGPTGGIYCPHFLPSEAGPRALLFAFGTGQALTMMVQDLETGRREILGPGTFPVYSPSGHIVYQTAGLTYDLWALPFSLDTLQATGRSFRIAEHSRDPTVAADGTLVYVDVSASGTGKLVWLNRQGKEMEEISQLEGEGRYLALSPDGGRMTVAVWGASTFQDLWVHDIDQGVRTRLGIDPDSVVMVWSSVWSPSGEQVAFTADRAGGRSILLQRADGSEQAQVLPATRGAFVCDWSRDGKYLFYELLNPDTSQDLWYLERKENGTSWEPHVFLQTPFAELAAQISPDGRHVAYVSNESGQFEIYVRPFPAGERKTTVSTNGGRQPRWSRDGKELFYAEGSTLVAVSVSTDPTFAGRSATRLFELPALARGRYPQYDVSLDGRQFLFAEPIGEAEEPSIQVVQNWFAEFKDRQRD